MNRFLRWVGLLMCMAWVLSLFGCGRGMLVDGPGMERKIWSEFTLSRVSESFEPLYTYTVNYDESSDKAYLHVSVHEGRSFAQSIPLGSETLSALLNLDLFSLPEAESLEGSFLSLGITDQMGQSFFKEISSSMEQEILILLAPYTEDLHRSGEEDPFMLDGPDMEYLPPWTAFSLTQCHSTAQYNFSFTLIDGEVDALLTGECRDGEGNVYEEVSGIPVSFETLQALHLLYLEDLPDAEAWPEDLELPLDANSTELRLTLPDGSIAEKNASTKLSIEIYQLLLPYFIQNQT